MDECLEQIQWMMTAEALWDFVTGDAVSPTAAADIGYDSSKDEQTPLFI
ncbi:hypothetical protein ACFFUB_08570 [Algimonas porphyrae]|uniref:Uncharacterized protein n=1 Tax=Algimonas porphyrae TaxID=1128113 RepID=A0ABQ5V324_9PROT|nr:hypothetical protein [Algimonas porphyrae]GLQ21934.1 hypothetical protein GCM10007854_28890 [Algimonas porphyrae]